VYPSLASLGADADPNVVGMKARGLGLGMALGLRVPPGFVVPIGAVLDQGSLRDAIDALQTEIGSVLGDPQRPLFIALRSSPQVSRPGELDTVLCFGATMDTMPTLVGRLSSRAAALAAVYQARTDAARVRGADVPSRRPKTEVDLDAALAEGVELIPDLPNLTSLLAAIRDRAVIAAGSAPTAIIVQAMVFGTASGVSGGLVAHSRHPITGEPGPRGEWVPGELGDQLTSGRVTPAALARSERPRDAELSLEARAAGAFGEIGRWVAQLESAITRPIEAELALENGALHLLQVRPSVLAPQGHVTATVALVEKGVLDRIEAFRRIDLTTLLRAGTSSLPDDASLATAGVTQLGRGLAASPGVASGRMMLRASDALAESSAGPVVLVRSDASPEDAPAVRAAVGVATLAGGLTSHAAVMSRALGRPCVVSVDALRIDERGGILHAGAQQVAVGEWVTVDGGSGRLLRGQIAARWSTRNPAATKLLDWARALADAPEDEPGPWYEALRASLG
jgi:pyruvate,orthophosphate dikinase